MPRGSGGSSRVARTSWAPAGRWSMTKLRISQQALERTRCASSRTRRNGRAPARVAPRAGRMRLLIGVTDSCSHSNTAGSTTAKSSSARARYVSSTTGSLSDVSSCSHAQGRSSACTHWTSARVLPDPAGADTTTNGADERSRSATRRRRGTTSTRGRGTCRFESRGWKTSSRRALRRGPAARPPSRPLDPLPLDCFLERVTAPPATLAIFDSRYHECERALGGRPLSARKPKRPAQGGVSGRGGEWSRRSESNRGPHHYE